MISHRGKKVKVSFVLIVSAVDTELSGPFGHVELSCGRDDLMEGSENI